MGTFENSTFIVETKLFNWELHAKSKSMCSKYVFDLINQLYIFRSEVSKNRFIDVRLDPIMDMKLETMREHVWNNIACIHKDSPLVSIWSSRRFTKGEHLVSNF